MLRFCQLRQEEFWKCIFQIFIKTEKEYLWHLLKSEVVMHGYNQGPGNLTILTNFFRVDWDLTLSMLVFTARQIHHSSPRINIGKWNLDRMTICGKA